MRRYSLGNFVASWRARAAPVYPLSVSMVEVAHDKAASPQNDLWRTMRSGFELC